MEIGALESFEESKLKEHKFLMQIAGKYVNQIHTNESSTPHPKLMPQQNHHHIINISNVQSIYLYNLQKHRQQIKLNVYDQLYHFL